MKKWTQEEEALLIQLKNDGLTYREIGGSLERTEESIKTRAKRLIARGLIKSSGYSDLGWKQWEVDLLSKNYDYLELSLMLGRTKRSVQSKCEKLGISKRSLPSGGGTGTMYKDKSTTLYLVDFGKFKKVGITQVGVETRLIHEKGRYVLLDSCDMSLEEAFSTEREILRNMREFMVEGDIKSGKLECFDYPCSCLEHLL